VVAAAQTCLGSGPANAAMACEANITTAKASLFIFVFFTRHNVVLRHGGDKNLSCKAFYEKNLNAIGYRVVRIFLASLFFVKEFATEV
jgi:hypothetical protein